MKRRTEEFWKFPATTREPSMAREAKLNFTLLLLVWAEAKLGGMKVLVVKDRRKAERRKTQVRRCIETFGKKLSGKLNEKKKKNHEIQIKLKLN